MAEKTQIQWADATWNIARGCSKVDADCKFCYMYRQSMNATRYKPDQVIRTKKVFQLPHHLNLKSSSVWDGAPLIFTSSLTDFFHPDIDSYRDEAWDIIRDHPEYIFQILTKRPERIKDHLPKDWGNGWDNVWMGTSVGSQTATYRIAELTLLAPIMKTTFLSLEPLHGSIETDLLRFFDWVIVGGESGNDTGKYRYRPCDIEWIRSIKNFCQKHNVPVFIKQMGTHLAKELKLSDRHGGVMEEWPIDLQVRQFPILVESNLSQIDREFPCRECDTGEMKPSGGGPGYEEFECTECGHTERYP